MSEKTKILVVDDDPLIVKATRRLLEKAGYQTFPAHTGQEALEAARRHHPDLILLDVNMPDMNGFDACRQLKADPGLADIGVIIVTSTYTDGESQAAGLDLGADGYIARPVSNRELLARVQAMLRTRAAEQQAQRIAAEWQATFDAVNSAVFLTDEHFTILKCNRTAEALFQTSAADIIGKKCYHLVHGSDQPIAACPLAAVRAEKQRRALTFEQGGRWLEVTVDPVLDENGNFIGSVHVVNDITERKRAEEALRQSEERLSRLIETVPDGITIVNCEGQITFANPAAEAILGLTRSKITERRYNDPDWRITAVDGSPFPDEELPFVRVMQSGQPVYGVEHAIEHPDGRRVILSINAAPIKDASNQTIGMIAAITDITEQKRAEEALRESEKRASIQRDAIAKLILDRAFAEGETSFALQRVVEILSASLDVARASIWVLEENGSLLRCLTLYEAGRGIHGNGTVLRATDFPRYFQAIQAESRISAEDAQNDPRTSELMENYLKPLGIASMLDAGIFIEGRLVGVVCTEHVGKQRVWHPDEEAFVSTVATSVAQLFLNEQRKRAEEALRESEEKYRLLAETTPDVIILHDMQGLVQYVNRAGLELSGLTEEQVIGQPITAFVVNEAQNGIRQRKAQRAGGNGSLYTYEADFLDKNGQRHTMEVCSAPIMREGKVAQIIIVARDITERKRAEEALRESEASLRRQNALISTLLENLRIGVFMVEAPSGKPLIANEAAKQLLGRGILPDASEKNLAEVYHARKQDSSEPYPVEEMPIVRGMYGEAAHVDDMVVTRPDGSEVLLEVFGTPIRDESGKVWASLVSFYDITERKRAEEALRESEERHRAISEFISDYAYSFRVEADNRLVREWVTAESFTRLTGYTPQEIDERGGWPSLIYPEDMPIAQARASRLFAGQHDVSEFRIVRKDGSIRWLRDHGHPIVDEQQGRVIRIYGAAQDITERKQREEEISRLNAELEARVEERTRQLKEAQEQLVRQEKLAVLGQLAGGVGHELRNPLAVINNAVYFLKLVLPQTDEKVVEYLNILERETHNAEKIISDLLDFARTKPAERQAIPAAELARRVFERYPAPENIRLVLDLPPLWVDARQIEQVLGNLVLNAYQAMPSGGELSVSSYQSSVTSHQSSGTGASLITDNCLLITVKDTGPGIPPENLPKLFEPLFTTKSHGIGLGLAVSKKLVEANGGRIEVHSEPGQGAAFTLILPIAKEVAP